MNLPRINNDTNGNPRYVCHYTDLLTDDDRTTYSAVTENWLNKRYDIAVKRANKIGGRKFHNKTYGGGIVFQSYNIEQTERQILELIK